MNAVYRRVPICDGAPTEADVCWLAGFILHPEHLEAGDALLERAERYLAAHGKTVVSTAYYPTYFTQGG